MKKNPYYLVIIILLFLFSKSYPNALDIFSFGPRSTGMGGVGAAISEDFTSVYYNPANLSLSQYIGIGIHYIYAHSYLDIKGAKVPVKDKPDDTTGIGVGAIFPIGGIFKKNLALGLGLHLPTNLIIRYEALTPEIPYYYMYQNLTQRVGIFLGTSYKIINWFSLGVGLQVLAYIPPSYAKVEINLNTLEVSQRDVTVDLGYKFAPIAGIYLNPLKDLTLGVSYRGSISLPLDLSVLANVTGVDVGNDDLISIPISIVTSYTPSAITLGLGYKWKNLLSSLDLTYYLWSEAPISGVQFEIDILGDNFLTIKDQPLNLKNILVPKIGFEYQITKSIFLRAGYSYFKTPIPPQTGITNLVDNSKNVITGGVGFNIGKIFIFPDLYSTSFDVALQIHLLNRQITEKEDPNDPVGDYISEGKIISATGGLNIKF